MSVSTPVPLLIAARPEDLQPLHRRGLFARGIRIQIASDTVDDKRRELLEHLVARNSAACGCNEGALAGLLYLIFIPLMALTEIINLCSMMAWFAVGGGFVATLLVGKTIGLSVSRWRLSRALAQIERLLETEKEGAPGARL